MEQVIKRPELCFREITEELLWILRDNRDWMRVKRIENFLLTSFSDSHIIYTSYLFSLCYDTFGSFLAQVRDRQQARINYNTSGIKPWGISFAK